MKRHSGFFAGLLFVAAMTAVAASWSAAQTIGHETTYYFSTAGDDRNDGLSPEHARRSLSLVPDLLRPGVTVRLERGDTWSGGTSLRWDLSGRVASPGARM